MNRITALLMGLGLVILFLGITISVITQTAQGKTWIVDDDGKADFNNVRDAIGAADDGDTIRVYEGVYHQNFTVDKGLRIIGNGSDTTHISVKEWGSKESVIWVKHDNTSIQGFNISAIDQIEAGIRVRSRYDNISISENWIEYLEIGIELFICSNSSVHNNTIIDTSEDAIWCPNSDNISIRDNRIVNYYNGIRIGGADNRVIGNSCFNSSGGTAFHIWSYACLVLDNQASHGYPYFSSPDMYFFTGKGHIFANNSLENGMRVLLSSHNDPLERNTFYQNNTIQSRPIFYGYQLEGARIDGEYGQIVLMNCSGVEINGSNLTGTYAAILLDGCSDITISNCSFSAGTFGVHGKECQDISIKGSFFTDFEQAAIFVEDSVNLRVLDSRLKDNFVGIDIDRSEHILVQGNDFTEGYSGVYVFFADNINIESNSFEDQERGINVWIPASNSFESISAKTNIFSNNTLAVKVKTSDGVLKAEKNWWGNDTGPYHPQKNPSGTGDEITDNVDFSPWLTEDGSLKTKPSQEELPWHIILFFIFLLLISLSLCYLLFLHPAAERVNRPGMRPGREKEGK